MSARFTISERRHMLVVTIEGRPTVDDLNRILSEIRTDSGYRHACRLWDFREAIFDFSPEELQRVAAFAAMADTTPGKVALLVSKDLSYGTSRMYGVFRSTEATQVNVFRSEREAVAWLTAPDD